MLHRGNYIWLLLLLFFSGCMDPADEREPELKKGEKPRKIFLDYKFWGEEGSDLVTGMLQFRYGNAYGRTIRLDDPAQVKLDGEIIQVDSTKMTGAFYEVRMPEPAFMGRHRLSFTDFEGREYNLEFEFQPMKLLHAPGGTIGRSGFTLQLQGLDPVDQVRVLLTDTSFYGDGINRLDTVRNGRLELRSADLAQLASGPIHLELFREGETRIADAPPGGGRLSISYRLSREYQLVEGP
jgi:hypothetical protein